MLEEPIAILIDIIKTQMGLDQQQIWQFNSGKVIPNTSGLFIVVEYLASKPYSTTSEYQMNDLDQYEEITTVRTQEMYSISIFSKDLSARRRKEEILTALASVYALQKQELYGFKIARVAERINNVSVQDGGSMLNRFVIDTKVLAWYKTTKTIDYYDRYPTSQTYN